MLLQLTGWLTSVEPDGEVFHDSHIVTEHYNDIDFKLDLEVGGFQRWTGE